MYYKLTQNEKVISIGQLPMSKENAKCEEITEEEYLSLSENFINQEKINFEMEALKSWFDEFYTRNEQKFRRLIALEKLDDDGIEPTIKLEELYLQAELNRKEIQRLETLLN